jgi:signal transduction histidine kinase
MRPGSVRVRLTVLVAFVAGLVALLAATIGADRVEQSLVDDVLDDAALEQVGFLELLFFEVDGGFDERSGFIDVDELPDSFFVDGFFVDDLFVKSEIEFIEATMVELDEVGELASLFDAARVPEGSDLPVLTNVGAIAMVDRAGGASIGSIGIGDIERPVIAQYTIDVVTQSLFDPTVGEIIGVGPGVVLPEVIENLEKPGDDHDDVTLRYDIRTTVGVELVIAGDVTDVVRSVDRIRGVLWAAAPVLVVLATIVTWILTGRALRPVQRMTERVGSISAGSLYERVPEPGTGDEIDRLAATMNGMLDRLEVDDRRLRRFVSDASHELRSPVAVLRSEAEVALRRDHDADMGRFAEGVLEESGRLQRIVEDLLVLARGEERQGSIAFGAIDLDDIVLDEAARRRRVPVDTSGVSAGRVRGTREAGERILVHLLDNAARHASSRAAVSLRTTGDGVELRVDDDGPGVPEVDRDRVFERFTRLEEARTRDGGGAGWGSPSWPRPFGRSPARSRSRVRPSGVPASS